MKRIAILGTGLAIALSATLAHATMIDNFSVPNATVTFTDHGGDSLFTSTGPMATGFGWDRQIDIRATGNSIQFISGIITGTVVDPSFLAIAESANSKGVRILSWDTTNPFTYHTGDTIAFDFKNVDQAFTFNLDINAFNNPTSFTINPGDTSFVANLGNWLVDGDQFDNITAMATSTNKGVDFELYSVTSTSNVPEPEALFLISLGLLGVGAAGANKKYHNKQMLMHL